MTRIFPKQVLLGLLMLASTTAMADGLASIKEAGALRVAVYNDYPPYSYGSGTLKGVDVDLAKALAERLGVGLNLMKLTADETMEDDLRNAVWKGHYLGGGTADVMMHVPAAADFAAANDKVIIFGPYFQEEIAIAHDPQRIEKIDTLLVFAREKVALEVDTIVDTLLSRAERGRLVQNMLHYRTVTEACDAFKNGEAAAFMATRAQLEQCIADTGDRFAIAPIPVTMGLFSWTVGMAVKEDNQELATALTEALAALQAEGVVKDIYTQHGLSYTVPPAQSVKE